MDDGGNVSVGHAYTLILADRRGLQVTVGRLNATFGNLSQALKKVRPMYFSDEKLASIKDYLDQKWPRPRTCPVCRENPDQWRVSETPVLLPLLTGNADISLHHYQKAIESVSVAPAIALTCSSCGHIVLFDAAKVGIASTETSSSDRFSIPSK